MEDDYGVETFDNKTPTQNKPKDTGKLALSEKKKAAPTTIKDQEDDYGLELQPDALEAKPFNPKPKQVE